jgi:hypothetical protein
MDLVSTLKNLGSEYVVKRDLNFEEMKIIIGLQTLSAIEEVKVLESCKDLEGSQYIQTLKRNSLAYAVRSVNGEILADEVTVEAGKKVSRFIFLCGCLDEWPAAIRDVLFDVFSDMNQELENHVSKTAKFTRYSMTTPAFAETKPMFRRVEEPETPEDDMEALKKKVEDEIDSENAKLNKAKV